MRKYHVIPLVLALFSSLSLASCNDDNPSSSIITPEEIHVESVSIENEETALKVGESLQLQVKVLPENATNKKVTYSANNDNVTVSSLGVVTAAKVGASVISVTSEDGAKTDSIDLQVIDNNPYANLEIADYVASLEESAFANDKLSGKEKYGLSNSGNVGVNQDLIQEKYPSKSDKDFNEGQIINVSDITLEEVQAYYSDVTEVNSYYQIQTAINKAKALNDNGKEAKVRFPEGKIDVDASLSQSGKTFIAEGLNGTYFEGNNTTICLHTKDLNWKGYFQINNSKNVHFNGVTFELDMPSSVTGKVIGGNIEENWLSIEIDPEFTPLMQLVETKKPKIRSWVEFGQIKKTPLEGGNFLVDDFSSYEVNKDAANTYSMKVTFKTSGKSRPRNGTLVAVQFSQYDESGIAIGNGENIYFEDVTMHHASGMAFTASNTTNLYVNRFQLVVKEDSASLMTATADAMHFSLMHGDVHITNSIIEYSHDDALNIKHGYWYQVSDKEGGAARTISATKITGVVDEPKVGDHIAVYDENTFESYNPNQGYYTIKSVTPITNGWKFEVNERLPNVGEWGRARITFLSNTPNFVFSNNIVRNKRNRGLLVQVPNAVVENNAFMYVGHGSIQTASAMDQFNEATLGQGITIQNNKFIGNCYIKPEPLYGDISVFAISKNASVAPKGTMKDIKINNNFISQNGNAAISFRGVGKSLVEDNLFNDNSFTQPSGDTFNTLFQLTNCGEVTIKGNYSQYTLNKGLSGWICEGTTAPSDIIASDNVNIKERENGEAGPIVQVSKATKSLTVDGNLTDWDEAGALDIAILGISDAEGTERTKEELSDHFKINRLAMTWNDQGIYFGFDIYDNELDVKTVNDFWLGDCVELFMSSIVDMPNADMQVYKDYDGGGVMQVAFAPTWTSSNYTAISNVRTKSSYVKNQSLIEVAFVTKSDGYTGEVLIPFTMAPEFKTAIEEGKQIDIAIVVADAERSGMGLKRVQMGNVPHFVEDYKTKTARMTQYFFQ